MSYLRRLLGRAGQQHRLDVLRRAVSPAGAAARLLVRAAIAGRVRALSHRRGGYRRWIELFDQLTQDDREAIARRIAEGTLPAINVVWAPGPNDQSADVARLIRSLQAQMLPAWTLTLLVGAAGNAAIADAAASSDQRVRIAHAKDARSGLPGEHLLLLFSPGVFREHSLVTFALAAASGASLAYCDTDRLDAAGTRSAPAFRPAFSPTLARQTNYFGPCIYVSDGARLAEIDLANELDVSRALADCEAGAVMQLPHILFHQTVEREAAIAAHEAADAARSVSIIIPTRDRVELVRQCIDSIHARSDYPFELIEIIVVDNGSVEPGTLDYLRDLAAKPNVQVIRDDHPFNYSRLNNLAARRAKGDVLVLLNNDIVIDDARWLRRLVSYAAIDDVGAVGGKLLYPDRTVQHAGVIFGIGGGARHAMVQQAEHAPGYLRLGTLDREVTAVTGACLAMRRELFAALGGLDERFAISFNDVTLCAEARRRGYRNICIATPLAIHFESKSRGFDDTPARVALARRELVQAIGQFRDLFRNDPFYSPNLSTDGSSKIAFPPRIAKPWRDRDPERKLHVVLLAAVGLGADVDAGLHAQVRALLARGHEVVIGSPGSGFGVDGCKHVRLHGPDHAAEFAVREGADCVVVHSAPFFAVTGWLGAAAKVIAIDYIAQADGEAAAISDYNRFWQAWADRVVTIGAGAVPVDAAALIEELCAS